MDTLAGCWRVRINILSGTTALFHGKRKEKPTVFLGIKLDTLQVLVDEDLFEHRAYSEQSTNVGLLLQCIDTEDERRCCELNALHASSTGMACISQSCYLRIEKNLSTAHELNLATLNI